MMLDYPTRLVVKTQRHRLPHLEIVRLECGHEIMRLRQRDDRLARYTCFACPKEEVRRCGT